MGEATLMHVPTRTRIHAQFRSEHSFGLDVTITSASGQVLHELKSAFTDTSYDGLDVDYDCVMTDTSCAHVYVSFNRGSWESGLLRCSPTDSTQVELVGCTHLLTPESQYVGFDIVAVENDRHVWMTCNDKDGVEHVVRFDLDDDATHITSAHIEGLDQTHPIGPFDLSHYV